MSNQHYHTLTIVSLLSSAINRSLMAPDRPLPPYMTALLSPTGESVKWEHGGGGCPVMLGELQFPGGDDIISYY